jgi:6-pyruvoyltetrahydropterin/6-carboxytetrahydropterin synthase
MYRISKTFKFEASHQLMGLPEGHPCGRLHGHSYEVDVTYSGTTLSKEGWLFDFGDLKEFGDWLKETFDHQHLNDIIEQPTSENLARYIYGYAEDASDNSELECVRVSETEKTYAEYWGGTFE